MKFKLLTVTMLALVLCGCGAMDSLIFHPLHVLHQQHEYNERAKAARAQEQLAWPTNSPAK